MLFWKYSFSCKGLVKDPGLASMGLRAAARKKKLTPYGIPHIIKNTRAWLETELEKNRNPRTEEAFMLAIKGIYDHGKITIKGQLPEPKAATEVIVIFPDNETKIKEEFDINEKRRLFEEFSGSIDRTIDIKSEKLQALEKKYENTY